MPQQPEHAQLADAELWNQGANDGRGDHAQAHHQGKAEEELRRLPAEFRSDRPDEEALTVVGDGGQDEV